MDVPASRARIGFALDDTPYPVIAIEGEERLNHGFFFQVDIQITLKAAPYTCEAIVVPRLRSYVSALPPKRVLPALIGVRIESDSPYSQFDEQGRYRLGKHFVLAVNPGFSQTISPSIHQPYTQQRQGVFPC
ncbi:MAG: hypothetical protein P8166_00295 [Candidatus Thiodiazotropha sp.]